MKMCLNFCEYCYGKEHFSYSTVKWGKIIRGIGVITVQQV
jgi:hypothetical protein